ncbi:hypothetical protein PLESTM_001501800 [Pleodorina starrii]|nr:hypothetical protein PLESTM_001501800 [Pleodorina starrii]
MRPHDRCNKTAGVTPYGIAPTYTTFPGSRATTTLYCFTIVSVPVTVVDASCGAVDTLSKIEFFANRNLNQSVKGFILIPNNGGPNVTLARSLGPGNSTLKATPIDWNQSQAIGSKVCVELYNPITMEDLCLGGGGSNCTLVVFNSNSRCCPLYKVVPAAAAGLAPPVRHRLLINAKPTEV